MKSSSSYARRRVELALVMWGLALLLSLPYVSSHLVPRAAVLAALADLAITSLQAPAQVRANSALTYTIVLTNSGPNSADSVVVSDPLPAGTSFVSCQSTGGGVCGGTGNNRTVSFAVLAPGASAVITLVASVNCAATDGAMLNNTASVNSATTDPNNGNNSATATTTITNPVWFYAANQSFAANGSAGSIQVNLPSDCAAPANSNDAWITVTGNSGTSFAGEGVLATQASFGVSSPRGVAVAPDGSVYAAGTSSQVVRRIAPNGIINTVAGTPNLQCSPSTAPCGDGGQAPQAQLSDPVSVAVAPDGSFYIADSFNGRIRRVAPPLPGFNNSDIAIPSSDGAQLYQFDAAGRHLRTLNTLTGANKYVFGYDSAGRLITITDGDNNITTVQRNGAGNPTGILSPFNQTTSLTLNSRPSVAADRPDHRAPCESR